SAIDQIEKSLPEGAVSAAQIPANIPAKSFFAAHHLLRMEPLHKDLVLRKRRSGKRSPELAQEIRSRFPVRAARFQGFFSPPDLTRTYIVTPAVGSENDLEAAAIVLRQDSRVESVQKEGVFHAQFIPNDPYFASFGSWGQPFDDLYGMKKVSGA